MGLCYNLGLELIYKSMPMYYEYNDVYGYMTHSPFHFVGSILSFLFWVLIAIFIIKLIKRKRGAHTSHWHHVWGEKDAIALLRERFAKSEISKEEYEEKLKVLEK